MNRMRKILLATLLVCPSALWAASTSTWPMAPMEPNLQDLPSLQSGFRLYANYCLGCHSLQYQRYERTADDLQIPHDLVLENLIFTDQKIGELMTMDQDTITEEYKKRKIEAKGELEEDA